MNALDPTNVQRNSGLARKVAAHGAGILMSSHVLDNVDRVCDSVVFMREGKLVELPAGGVGSLVTYNELYGSATPSAHARPQGEVLEGARPCGRRFPRP